MGATIDLNLVTTKNIKFEKMIKLLVNKFKTEIKICNIEVMDNWEYENVKQLLGFDDNIIGKYIEQFKIVNVELLVANNNAGIQIQKIEDRYETDIWMNTDNFSYLDSDSINEANKEFYDKTVNLVLQLVREYEISIAALGVETIFEYSDNVYQMINKSHNIIVWIMAGKYPKHIEKYNLYENDQSNIGIFIKKFENN